MALVGDGAFTGLYVKEVKGKSLTAGVCPEARVPYTISTQKWRRARRILEEKGVEEKPRTLG